MSLSIERRAALWDDRTAVVDDSAGETLSYADLAARADRAAGRLAALGVERGDAVSLVSRNRPASLVLPFAARRLGAVYAPLSHHLPPSAVAGPHDAVSPAVVVHEPAQRDLVRGLDPDETVTLDAFRDVEPAGYRPAGDDPDAALLAAHGPTGGDVGTGGGWRDPEDGSDRTDADDAESDDGAETSDDETDRGDARNGAAAADGPRVVRYSARAVEWNCVTEAAAWGLGRTDLAPVVLALSHATGLLGLALPLLYVGGTLVVRRAFDPGDVLAVVAERGATCLLGRAPELRELAGSDGFDRVAESPLSWVACADAVPDAVRADFAAHGVPVSRTFGTVETGPNNLYVPPDRANDAPPDSVGRPFPDCEVRVEDPEGGTAEEGAVGVLSVRGPVVADGYVGGGDGCVESDDGCVGGNDGHVGSDGYAGDDDGYGGGNGSVGAGDGYVGGGDGRFGGDWVRTGALARRAPGGDYHVVGRRSRSGRHDVSDAAVERVLGAHDAVTAAAVVPGADAAVVAGDVGSEAVAAHVGRLLPDAAVPGTVHVVDALPRRETGAVDREALRRRFGSEGGPGS